MARTYTQHKLTDHQLQRLSAVVNGREPRYGMAFVALVNKGLIAEWFDDDMGRNVHEACDEGREALAQARKEGW